jgi:Gpi18-like mannosyltransferase
LLGLGLFLRILFIVNPGFEADISFWKSWGLATYDKGIIEGMKVTNNNYPTPFAYTLGGMVWLYSRVADPHNFNEFWSNTNLLFLAISKLYPILADVGIVMCILYIGSKAKMLGFPEIPPLWKGFRWEELAAAAYFLSPVSIIDGAWWGQIDAAGVALFLIALILAFRNKPLLTGAVFMLAMMTKLQNMIYGPVLFLFIWQIGGLPGLLRAISGAVIAFMGLNIEFILTRNTDRVFASLTENFDYFPWMSLNAYNLWWIVTGGHGMAVSDKLLQIGIANAKTIGLLLFSSLYLFAVLRQLKEGTTRMLAQEKFFESLIVVNGAFFLFQTQSHDRYAFPVIVFLLLWLPYALSHGKETKVRRTALVFALLYGIFTASYFYNLHTALVINYPQNGLPILSLITQPFFTIATAVILLGLFAAYLTVLLRKSRTTAVIAAGCLCICLAGLLAVNKPLITKKPVPLTALVPYISEQQYGTRQVNKSVQSSFGGPNAWTRLSVQYVFYRNGFGTHANSRMVFNTHKQFSRFTTDMGVDTEAGPRASVVFELSGDGKSLYRSPKMGRFDMPKHADVSIAGVENLTLTVTDAGDDNFDDHADWLSPTLWP